MTTALVMREMVFLAELGVVAGVLQFVFDVLLLAVFVQLYRVADAHAKKRGLLDAVDLMHRRKRWYS